MSPLAVGDLVVVHLDGATFGPLPVLTVGSVVSTVRLSPDSDPLAVPTASLRRY